MVLEQRSLGSPALATSLLYGVSGQEEGHVRHAAVTSANGDIHCHSFRLRVRISNLRGLRTYADVSWGSQILLAPAVAPSIQLGTKFVIRDALNRM